MESPALKSFTANDAEIFYSENGDKAKSVILWGHGWGQSHAAFEAITSSLARQARHIRIDFPGFGASPKPPTDWSTEEYADMVAAFIKAEALGPVFWAGHSFGGRVGIQLAAKYPDLLRGLIIISGAGLKRKRGFFKSLYFKSRILTYKTLKLMTHFGLSKDWLQQKFGSSDYKNAGEMRGIFIKVVNEDLTEQARTIKMKTLLFYGANDTETPPEFGQRFKTLIQNSDLFVLDGQDHYSVLSSGRHTITRHISNLLKEMDC